MIMHTLSLWRRPLLRQLLGIFVLVTLLPSCLAWHTHTGPIEQAVARGGEDVVRVTRVTGQRHDLSGAHVANDSVVGVERSQRTKRVVQIPVGEVQQVQTQQADAGRTTLFFAVLIGLGVVALTTISDEPVNIALQLRR
jgi:hypothetical protein